MGETPNRRQSCAQGELTEFFSQPIPSSPVARPLSHESRAFSNFLILNVNMPLAENFPILKCFETHAIFKWWFVAKFQNQLVDRLYAVLRASHLEVLSSAPWFDLEISPNCHQAWSCFVPIFWKNSQWKVLIEKSSEIFKISATSFYYVICCNQATAQLWVF